MKLICETYYTSSCVKSVSANSAVGDNEEAYPIGIYGGRVWGNNNIELGKRTKKGCSKGKRNDKRLDMSKRDNMPLRRIWTGEGVMMIPPLNLQFNGKIKSVKK